jgi:hypothetical protein
MDGNGRRCDAPREVDAKEPFNNTHKITLAALTEQAAEQGFNSGIFGEVDEVVNVKAQRERMFRRTAGGVLWVTEKSGVKAGVFQGRGETDRNKNSINFVVPMSRTSTETIKCFEE